MAVSSDQAPEEGGILSGLLAPLRLPERVMKALDSLAAASEHLGPMRAELTRMGKEIPRVREQTEMVPDLPPLVARISEQAEPLAELLPALEGLERGLGERLDGLEKSLGKRLDDVHEVIVALEGDESTLNKTVGALAVEIAAMHKTIGTLQGDVKRATDRLPDPDAQGPLAKARDVLTGSGD